MRKTTKMLVDEHKNILKVADALEKECDSIKSRKSIDEVFFKQAIDFIRNYADRFHHAKEEDILFKEMCKDSAQEQMHCNPVEQMLYEHDTGRNYVKGMINALTDNNQKKLIENALGYVGLIRDHIFKEDNILYPMAEQVFNNKIEKSMLSKFEKIAKQRAKDKLKYEKIAQEFAKRK